MLSLGSGWQWFTNPNFSPVGRYSMVPTAEPKGAAGCEHTHTGCDEVGQSERVEVVLVLWNDSAEVEPTALMKGMVSWVTVKLA